MPISQDTKKVASTLQDRIGNAVEVGAFGELRVAEPIIKIAVTFEYPFDEDNVVDVTTTGTGTAVAQVDGSLCRVRTNGTGTACVLTKDNLRYTAGATAEQNSTVAFVGTPTANTEMLAGLFDDEDGFYLGYKGTDFVCGYRNDGSAGTKDTEVTSGNFNGDFDIATYLSTNRTNIHRIRIKFGYLGVGNASFEIKPDRENGEWRTVHIFKTDGALSGRTHTGTPILPIKIEVSATGGEDVYIESGSWSAITYARPTTAQDRPFHDYGSLSIATGDVVAYRVKTLIGSKMSKVVARLIKATFATGTEGLCRFRFIVNPTSITGGAWSDVERGSIVEVNTTFTSYAGGVTGFTVHVPVPSQGSGNSGEDDVDFSLFGIKGRPGESFVIVKDRLFGSGGDNTTAWAISGVEEY